jgi:UPF0755 protein
VSGETGPGGLDLGRPEEPPTRGSHRRAESRRTRREREPRDGHGGVVALVALLLVGALVAAGWFGLQAVLDRVNLGGAEDYAGPGSGEVVIEVTAGQSSTAIGRTLEENDVVASVDAFTDAARADSRAQSLQPGFYALQQQMRAQDALDRMLDPASRVESRVTVPEGLRIDETLQLISEQTEIPLKDLRAAARDAQGLELPAWAEGNAEGLLFPATYTVRPDATAASLLREMVATFQRSATNVGLEGGQLSPYETLIVASLVEGEARLDEDFARVARVVYNRLEADMPLQFDSTVNYAMGADNEFVSLDDLGTESPYNTYQNKGLPPGPISSPGEAAMQAALDPADGDWLYFVTTNPETGETKFTASYDEFLQFKAEYKRNTGS